MPLSRRYTPEWNPDETATIGMDFSMVVPPGVGIHDSWMGIETNTANPQVANTDFTSPSWNPATGYFTCTVQGRTVYVQLTGGVEGRDYRLSFVAACTDGSVFPRTALLLCAPTS